jgi:serine/threonine protein kinase
MKLLLSLVVVAWQCALCILAKNETNTHQKMGSSPPRFFNAAETANGLFKTGYRVNIIKIPKLITVPTNVSWNSLTNVTKLTASAAYNIFTAFFNGEKVVIKSLRGTEMRSGSPIEMEKEINLLSRMDHPNIIKLLGSGYLPYRFQILEYLGGGTLHKVLKNQLKYTGQGDKRKSKATLLPQEKMFEFGIKIASALHYIHEDFHPSVRLFHRDLKMQNIGFSSDGELKVFDFGMSELIRKAYDENHLFTLGVAAKQGKALGTWPYTAPEVLRREKYNHKSDVYSFAIILYYIMVGKHPMRYFGDHLHLKKEVGVYDGWRPSPEPRWPGDLVHLFAQIWNNDVYVRPNMGEIVEQLKDINNKHPDIYTRPPPQKPTKKGVKYVFVDEVVNNEENMSKDNVSKETS